jgi:hypothetical protein
VTDRGTDWSATNAILTPNQGDYVTLVASGTAIVAAWADGRDGSPDAYMASADVAGVPPPVQLVTTEARPDRAIIEWRGPPLQLVRILRREADLPFDLDLGETRADAGGRIIVEDTQVVPGRHYRYALRVEDALGTYETPEVAVDVPHVPVRLTIEGVRPNPSRGPLQVLLDLPGAEEALVEIVDLAGRVVRTRHVGQGPRRAVVDLAGAAELPPGVYLVRVTQGARRASAKAVIVR